MRFDMIKEQLRVVLERVADWPQDRQQELWKSKRISPVPATTPPLTN
jgi:hypothetical protein